MPVLQTPYGRPQLPLPRSSFVLTHLRWSLRPASARPPWPLQRPPAGIPASAGPAGRRTPGAAGWPRRPRRRDWPRLLLRPLPPAAPGRWECWPAERGWRGVRGEHRRPPGLPRGDRPEDQEGERRQRLLRQRRWLQDHQVPPGPALRAASAWPDLGAVVAGKKERKVFLFTPEREILPR